MYIETSTCSYEWGDHFTFMMFQLRKSKWSS